MSFMDGIKMTNRLMITKRTKVTTTWRHKSNFVFLAISNNDERTCRGGERERESFLSRIVYEPIQSFHVYFNWFFTWQMLHRSVRKSGFPEVVSFEILLKINMLFQNCRYMCMCSRIFFSFFNMPFWILLHLKRNFTSELAPAKLCDVRKDPCIFNLKQV